MVVSVQETFWMTQRSRELWVTLLSVDALDLIVLGFILLVVISQVSVHFAHRRK